MNAGQIVFVALCIPVGMIGAWCLLKAGHHIRCLIDVDYAAKSRVKERRKIVADGLRREEAQRRAEGTPIPAPDVRAQERERAEIIALRSRLNRVGMSHTIQELRDMGEGGRADLSEYVEDLEDVRDFVRAEREASPRLSSFDRNQYRGPEHVADVRFPDSPRGGSSVARARDPAPPATPQPPAGTPTRGRSRKVR